MPLRIFSVIALTLVSLVGSATAREYQINWKNGPPEGVTKYCYEKITGVPVIGPTTLLRWDDGFDVPLPAYIPENSFKFSYNPPSGCSSIVVEVSCYPKNSKGSKWQQKLTIMPCQNNRTILISENGARLE